MPFDATLLEPEQSKFDLSKLEPEEPAAESLSKTLLSPSRWAESAEQFGSALMHPVSTLQKGVYAVDKGLGLIPKDREPPPLEIPKDISEPLTYALRGSAGDIAGALPGATPGFRKAVEGGTQGVAETALSFVNPDVLTAGAALQGGNAAAQAAIKSGFITQIANQFPDLYKKMVHALRFGDESEIAKASADIAASAAIPAGIVHEAFKSTVPAVPNLTGKNLKMPEGAAAVPKPVQTVEPPKEGVQNAIQERVATPIPLAETPGDSEKVGEGVPAPAQPPGAQGPPGRQEPLQPESPRPPEVVTPPAATQAPEKVAEPAKPAARATAELSPEFVRLAIKAGYTKKTAQTFADALSKSEAARKNYPEAAAALETAKPPAKRAGFKREVPGTDRPWDVIDEYEANIKGKINLNAARKLNKDYKPTGAARKLFSPTGTIMPDDAAQALAHVGVTGEEHLLDKLNDAAQARIGGRTEKAKTSETGLTPKEQLEMERQQDFQKDSRKIKGKETIIPDDYIEGDSFEMNGHKVKIKEFEFDDTTGDIKFVTLEDGSKYGTQRVPGGTAINVDAGTVKANKPNTEFLSETERGQIPISAKAEAVATPPPASLTPEQMRNQRSRYWNGIKRGLLEMDNDAGNLRLDASDVRPGKYDVWKTKDGVRTRLNPPNQPMSMQEAQDFAVNHALKETGKATLELAKPESVDEATARQAQESAAAESKRLEDERQERAAAKMRGERERLAGRIGGDLGSAGQGKLFDELGQQEIFQATAPKTLAAKIRSAKINTGDLSLEGSIVGIPLTVWNGALEAMALGVESGKAIKDIVASGIEYIRANHKGTFDEDELRSQIHSTLGLPEPRQTSLKNATAELERAGFGLPEATPADKQEMVPAWERAGEVLKKDPMAGQDLAEELIANPKMGLTGDQSALLLRHKTEKFNALNEAAEDVFKGTEEERQEAGRRFDRLKASYEALLDAIKARGTEWGREGRWRQALAGEDYSFATQERLMRGAKRGELTDTEREDLHKEVEAHKAKADALAKLLSETASKAMEFEAKAASEKLEADALRENPPIPEHVRRIADKVKNYLDDRGNRALKELQGTAWSISPEVIAKLVDLGASKLGARTIDFAQWSAEMLSHFPEKVEQLKPYLEDIWNKAKAFVDRTENDIMRGAPTGTKENLKRLKSDAPLEEQQSDAIEKIKAKAESGRMEEVGPLAQKLAKIAVRQGARGWRQVNDAVHAMLKGVLPDWDYRDTMQAVSGQGKFTLPKKDEVSVALRDAKSQTLEIVKIQKVIAGEPVHPTGLVRDRPSDIKRRFTQIYENVKRRFGLKVDKPEVQLRSALQARKTYLENRMADLRYEIGRKQRIVKAKALPPTDPELQQMQAEYEQVKAEHKGVFGDRKLTDEQRLKMALASMEKQATEYERKSQAGEFTGKKEPSPLPDTPELKAAQARRDAAKAAYEELRGLDEHYQNEQAQKQLEAQIEAAQKAVAESKRKLATGDVAPKKGLLNRPSANEQLEVLRQERDALNRQLADARKKPEAQKDAEKLQRQIESKNKLIEEKKAAIASGNVAAKGNRVNRPLGNEELEKQQQELDALNRQIQELRNPPKSPEERALQAAKSRMTARIAKLTEYENSGNFANGPTPPRRPVALDSEAERLKVDLSKIEQRIKAKRLAYEREHRNRYQKIADAIKNLNRVNILSHVSVIEHLSGAAVENLASRPVATAMAQLFRFNRTLNDIRKKAVYEGGASGKAEWQGIVGAAKSYKAVWDKLLTGKSNLDWLHSTKNYPKEFAAIVQNMHGAIKEPVRQGIYARSMQLRTEAAEAKGLDPANDKVLATILSKEAYDDANMDIFMGDNILSKAVHGFIGQLRNSKTNPGMGNFVADVADILMPIVNVPTNIALRKLRLLVGLPESAVRVGLAHSRGQLENHAETLTPRDAELITRAFKYGSLGLALGAYAWFHPQHFGGIYSYGTPAPKDKSTGLKPGEIKVGDETISHHFTHGPIGGHMNAIADARRLYDKEVKNNPDSPWSALSDAAFFALYSGVSNLPQFFAFGTLTSPFTSAGQKIGQEIKNIFIPGFVQDTAEAFDKDSNGNPISRRPKTFPQEIESAIPGLRKNVPVKKK